MTTITLEHISKSFGSLGAPADRVSALHNISLKLEQHTPIAVLGPSGCGKSTLLRVIAGLLPPDSGQVLYDGVPLEQVDPKRRGIGMVFQEGALIPHWESGRSVGFFLALRKREAEVPERVRRISQITGIGLEVLMQRRPSQLSGGEKQRVSIARALTRDLDVLLLDEPFANIDAKLRTEARIELKRLLREYPVTMVYVTHDQSEALTLGRKLVVMRDGHIEQVGSYDQLYNQPVNLFVAKFIGTQAINTFNGFAIGGSWQGNAFTGLPIRKDLPEAQRVVMAIRPENIRVAAPEDTFIAQGTVRTVTPYYAERYQQVSLTGDGETWQLHVPLDLPVRPREGLRCALDPASVLFFDAETGKRIA